MATRRRWPKLRSLHKRHRALSESICAAYTEAAEVALSRHHLPPLPFTIERDGDEQALELRWEIATERARAAWANEDDTTRDAAYVLTIAAVEIDLGLRAISRAETRTGADYYLGHPKAKDGLERAYRLEVSGVDHGSDAQVRQRIREKVQQTRRGRSDLPAIAGVVGFKVRRVVLQAVEDDDGES